LILSDPSCISTKQRKTILLLEESLTGIKFENGSCLAIEERKDRELLIVSDLNNERIDEEIINPVDVATDYSFVFFIDVVF
jgi:hypothetical protein